MYPVWENVRKALQVAADMYKRHANKKCSPQPTFQVRDKVFLSTKYIHLKVPCHKLGPKFMGPFPIIRVINLVTVELKLPPMLGKTHLVFHSSLLKPVITTGLHNLPTPSSPVQVDGEWQYEIEQIVDSRRHHGTLQYLVVWKRYPCTDASWVMSTEVRAPRLIAQFHHRYPDKPIEDTANSAFGLPESSPLVVYGHDFVPIPEIPREKPQVLSLSEWSDRLREMWPLAYGALDAAHQAHKKQGDKKRVKPKEYTVGDRVYLSTKFFQTSQKSKKLGPKYVGPFPIIKVINPVSVHLELPKYLNRVYPVFHVNLLKPERTSLLRASLVAPPAPLLIESEQHFEIKEILDSRKHRNRIQYLVAWKHFPTSRAPMYGLLCFFTISSKYVCLTAKVQQEIDEVVGTNRTPSMEDRLKMPFTNAVVHEVQRYEIGSAESFPRATTCDVKFHGYNIPKCITVAPILPSLHYDPLHWETPEKFNPDHFLDEKGQFRKIDAFMPFSAGKRACPGEALARMELFLFFSTLLQRLTFYLDGDTKDTDVMSLFMAFNNKTQCPLIQAVKRSVNNCVE
ncbi:PREDICTED: cytochrome P450 3A30-like [Thamnophis sirtalis]|uniref:Cytochrome P450 3A30-like n=1 Tax=Thamnophis sirtalis TaxID=35019 RepID=A0A6I9X1K4_9SAUR|nr:PREDICTED: cytochrome P450 3A30-like [Thamnophis sirtalis]